MRKFAKIIKKKSEYELIKSFIVAINSYILKTIQNKKRFSFVLTGGKSPINLYKKLSNTKLNWEKVDFFWGDERHVSKSSKFSNFNLVKKFLFKNINIKKNQVFSFDTGHKSTETVAKNYKEKIKKYFKKSKIKFDLIILGMGNDGHVASIFEDQLNEKKFVKSVYRKDFKRITMTMNLINSSKEIWLWLPTKTLSRRYAKFKNQKKIVVNSIRGGKLKIFSILI